MRRIRIGRASDNDIVFNRPSISGHHADIVIDGGVITLTDHSKNGTWVNGRKVHNGSVEIRRGDRVMLPENVCLNWKDITEESHGTQPFYPPGKRSGYDMDGSERGSQRQAASSIPRVTFGKAISHVMSHYADFTGRARRSEYWWFVLFHFILLLIPGVNVIWALAAIIPMMAVTIRRLHDTGKSGWCVLFALLPLVGTILLIVWCCQDSSQDSNRYGKSPKYRNK